MKKEGYFSSGEFAKMAGVTVRTIRFYDKQNILKPSLVTESGARFYTQEDMGRLQQILLLKYLGLSLDDIKELTFADEDHQILRNQLAIQKTLIQDKIEQMQLVQQALENTIATIDKEHDIDWNRMQELTRLTSMENTLKAQYLNSNNVNARIRLHSLYSTNKQGWFPWVFEQCQMRPGMRILEIGCGNGSLWLENKEVLPENMQILLTDASQGMLRDTRRSIQGQLAKKQGNGDASAFRYQVLLAEKLSTLNQEFDLIIANHVLFYFNDMELVLGEIARHLSPEGVFICSTYGVNHMRQIRELVKEFDERISLSGDILYDRFGLQNGKKVLEPFFQDIELRIYPDELVVDQLEPLLEYILSCHGNQNQYLLDRYKDFRGFLERKTRNGFHITKEAGVFIGKKRGNL